MQDEVRRFLAAHDLSLDSTLRHIDLTSEVGELGKELLKAGAYGTQPIRPNGAIALEAGDCLFSLLALCESLSIDAQAALAMALDKYRRRFDAAGHIGSGAERE